MLTFIISALLLLTDPCTREKEVRKMLTERDDDWTCCGRVRSKYKFGRTGALFINNKPAGKWRIDRSADNKDVCIYLKITHKDEIQYYIQCENGESTAITLEESSHAIDRNIIRLE